MQLSLFRTALLTFLYIAPESAFAAKSYKPTNAILLSNVKSLTLRYGSKTAHRRVSAVPQLKCVGGNAKGLYEVEVMRCLNQGSDYDDENIQWSCTANLPLDFKLGSTEVVCEGYESSSDAYVLKGSCGVEYTLFLTEQGEAKHGSTRDGGFGPGTRVEKLVGSLFWVFFLLVAGWILYSIYVRYNEAHRASRRPRHDGFGGGGGAGGGDPWDPPPPYPGRRFYTKPGQQEGWRPGFWTGTAAGVAAGYLARGGRGRHQTAPVNSWVGGNGGGMDYGTSPSRPFTRSSSSSSSRHESTGFGSTSRR